MATVCAVPEEDYHCMCSVITNFCQVNVTREKMDAIKTLYGDDINSVRRKDSIETMTDLISILEKRDCLSHTNIKILYEVADILKIRHLINPFINRLQHVPDTKPNRSYQYEQPRAMNNHGTNEDLIKRKVHQVISEQLGKSWIDFARALHMRECRIDELKIEHPTSPRICTIKVLEFHEEEAHPRVWRSGLQQALLKARRKDLYNSIQNIYDTYS